MSRVIFIATISLLGGLTSANGAFDAYLLLEKNGPVETDATHSWVEVLGFEQGVENTITSSSTTGGLTSGKVSATEATLQIASDQSVARMMTGLAKGEEFTLTLHLVRPGTSENPAIVMTEYIFDETLFSKIRSHNSTTDGFVSFQISFLYGTLRVIHTEISQMGTPENPTSAGWTFVENKEIAVPSQIPLPGDYGSGGSPPPPNPDRDGDLMPNTWETTYGLNPDNPADALLDPDKDGFTNLQEFIAGTHPKQSNSFFRTTMTPLTTGPGVEVEFTWSAIQDRTYIIQTSATPGGTYSTIHTITTTSNGPQTYRPPAGAGPYFRLGVRQ